MHLLDITTILLCGLLAGNELALSLFINPAIWKLNDLSIVTELARVFGAAMPFWYALCFLLLAAEAWLHRHTAAEPLLLTAAILWALTIVFTLLLLVPRNNRIAAATSSTDWLPLHRQWDRLHRVRIAAVILSTIFLISGLQL